MIHRFSVLIAVFSLAAGLNAEEAKPASNSAQPLAWGDPHRIIVGGTLGFGFSYAASDAAAGMIRGTQVDSTGRVVEDANGDPILIDIETRFGAPKINVGLYGGFEIFRFLDATLGVNYSQAGFEYTDATRYDIVEDDVLTNLAANIVDLYHIRIPMTVRFSPFELLMPKAPKLLRGLYIGAGGSLAFMILERRTSNGYPSNDFDCNERYPISTDCATVPGFRGSFAKVSGTLELSLGFKLPLTPSITATFHATWFLPMFNVNDNFYTYFKETKDVTSGSGAPPVYMPMEAIRLGSLFFGASFEGRVGGLLDVMKKAKERKSKSLAFTGTNS